jgi:hypothetical protein
MLWCSCLCGDCRDNLIPECYFSIQNFRSDLSLWINKQKRPEQHVYCTRNDMWILHSCRIWTFITILPLLPNHHKIINGTVSECYFSIQNFRSDLSLWINKKKPPEQHVYCTRNDMWILHSCRIWTFITILLLQRNHHKIINEAVSQYYYTINNCRPFLSVSINRKKPPEQHVYCTRNAF